MLFVIVLNYLISLFLRYILIKNEIDVYRNKMVEPIKIMSVTPSSLFVEYTRIPNKIIKIVYTNNFNIALTDIFIPYL